MSVYTALAQQKGRSLLSGVGGNERRLFDRKPIIQLLCTPIRILAVTVSLVAVNVARIATIIEKHHIPAELAMFIKIPIHPVCAARVINHDSVPFRETSERTTIGIFLQAAIDVQNVLFGYRPRETPPGILCRLGKVEVTATFIQWHRRFPNVADSQGHVASLQTDRLFHCLLIDELHLLLCRCHCFLSLSRLLTPLLVTYSVYIIIDVMSSVFAMSSSTEVMSWQH